MMYDNTASRDQWYLIDQVHLDNLCRCFFQFIEYIMTDFKFITQLLIFDDTIELKSCVKIDRSDNAVVRLNN